jgi:bifunctional UDP-N-acetylglucosamine pyrophosphorylase/glucosamine-1-phosphate N-acetyltransferase
VIGRKVNFGAGTITANLRHDNKTVKVSIKGKRIDSKRRKMGAVIGDNVKTGIGTLIAPGIVLHQGSRTGVGVIVDNDIEPEKLVLTDQSRTVVDVRQE